MSVTPGPWRVGYWSGRCHKEHPGRAQFGHPGPGGPDGCVYDPEFIEGGQGIAGPEVNQTVVGTSYDELVISDDDARLIAAAPDMLAALIFVRKLWAPDDSCAEIREIDQAIAKATCASPQRP